MDQRELQARVRDLAARARVIVMAQAPVRTGNLMNSIRVRYNENGFTVFIDTNQAEYAVYTTDPWVSPRWQGRANPNEGWFDQAAELLARYVASGLGGYAVRKK
jgi:hypothetical protein